MIHALGLPLVCFTASTAFLVSGLLREPPAARTEPAAVAPEVEERSKHQQLCSACHPLLGPRNQRKEDWPGVVETMRRLSEERGFPWTEEDFDAALRHLQRHGR